MFAHLERFWGINRPAIPWPCPSGVLLLNAVLTVRAHQANSHKDQGWETFTDAVVQWLSNNLEGLVFMLWGSYAQKKGATINRVRNSCCLDTNLPNSLLHFNHSHVFKLVFPPSPSLETASHPAGCAPVSPVGSPRLLWMQALLKGQRAAREIRKDSCRLEGTLTCYTCQLVWCVRWLTAHQKASISSLGFLFH